LFFSLFYFLHTHKKSYKYGIAGIFVIFLIAVTIIQLFPNRIEKKLRSLTFEDLKTKNIFEARNVIWKTSYSLAMKHTMWGIGIGYQPEDYLTAEELKMYEKPLSFINTHNQFLQTFLEQGIIGFCLLTFFILYSFYYAIKTKRYLLFMLLIEIFINMFFESLFELSYGIFTFSLFYCLFVVKNNIFATVSKK
jgi:O-antigen ligase